MVLALAVYPQEIAHSLMLPVIDRLRRVIATCYPMAELSDAIAAVAKDNDFEHGESSAATDHLRNSLSELFSPQPTKKTKSKTTGALHWTRHALSSTHRSLM